MPPLKQILILLFLILLTNCAGTKKSSKLDELVERYRLKSDARDHNR